MGAHIYFLLLKIFFNNTCFKGLNDWCGAVVPFSSGFIYFNDQHTGTRKSPSLGNKILVTFPNMLLLLWPILWITMPLPLVLVTANLNLHFGVVLCEAKVVVETSDDEEKDAEDE